MMRGFDGMITLFIFCVLQQLDCQMIVILLSHSY